MRYLPVYIDLNQQKQLIDMVQSDPDRPPGIIRVLRVYIDLHY